MYTKKRAKVRNKFYICKRARNLFKEKVRFSR